MVANTDLNPAREGAAAPDAVLEAPRAEVLRDASFYGMLLTQFLAVFNDNFYKQIVLFICVERAMSGAAQDLQGTATIVFSLPFIIFSGFSGYLSDLISKRRIIVIAKVAEVVIMLLAFLSFHPINLPLMFMVLFLLGTHSTLYAPAKYGLLPELFADRDLPRVNGLFQMTMFLAIILGLACSGVVKERVGEQVWIVPVICMAIAGLGFFTSLLIRPMPAAQPGLKFHASNLILNKETRKLLWKDHPLMWALGATSIFWMTGGLIYPLAINDLGIRQMQIGEEYTGYMAAGTGLGIAIGCVLGMVFSHGKFNAKLIRIGSWGMMLGLLLLAAPGSALGGTLLGFWGSCLVLVWLGVCAGMYQIPLQVYIQAKSPTEHKGRIIGAMNLANWIGIYSSGVLYKVANPIIASHNWPHNLLFGLGAIFFLPVVLLYRPRSVDL
jgi:acyl-[acyl-carrier-protein]-phospholipid O-acyltransferase/long-chain-fatty-acid--[acyl-carrier-protein] ligase